MDIYQKLPELITTFHEQTGQLPGGPTGQCSRWVDLVLSDGELPPNPHDWTTAVQTSLINRGHVPDNDRYAHHFAQGMRATQIHQLLTDQPEVSIVELQGNTDSGEPHASAVVRDSSGGLHVIDSLSQDGMQPYEPDYLDTRFPGGVSARQIYRRAILD